uniref:Secreted protein n=1 Tax=Arundo donax TaxID=35708 RepID=A0A0A9CP30_ARUDO
MKHFVLLILHIRVVFPSPGRQQLCLFYSVILDGVIFYSSIDCTLSSTILYMIPYPEILLGIQFAGKQAMDMSSLTPCCTN